MLKSFLWLEFDGVGMCQLLDCLVFVDGREVKSCDPAPTSE